jgi:long-chain acyl-CoA synthetase
VEAVYLEDPIIREIGILQKDGNLVAVIVPNLSEIRQRGEEIESAVRKAAQAQSKKLPSFQRVTDYALTREPLSRTRLGKVRRHLLLQRYDRARHGEAPLATVARPISIEEMSDEDQALLENSKARQVWQWLASRYPSQRLTPDSSPQLDLGMDSLEWLSITLEIRERVSIELDEAALARIDTVRDLLQEVVSQGKPERSSASPLEEPEKVLDERQMRLLEPLGALSSTVASGCFALNRLLMRTVFRLQVQGLENLPEGQFVITPNHLSHLDSFAIAAALNNQQLRNTYWAAWGRAWPSRTRCGGRSAGSHSRCQSIRTARSLRVWPWALWPSSGSGTWCGFQKGSAPRQANCNRSSPASACCWTTFLSPLSLC